MDLPASPVSSHSRGRLTPRTAAGLAAFVLILYAAFLSHYVGAVAGGSDSSGYVNHARLLAAGNVHAPVRMVAGLPPKAAWDYLYVPLGFRPSKAKAGTLVPTYPVGLPLMILAAAPLTGWKHAGDAVLILHAVAGLVLIYLLGRILGLDPRWAFLGTLAIGSSPLYSFMSLQAMSDVPSLVWTTAAVIAAWFARDRPRWALAAGGLAAVDVLLRPSNVLVFLPVAVALGFSPRRWGLLALGGIPGAVFLCAYNRAVYGNPFTTGYGDTRSSFRWAYVPETLAHYAHWLPILLTPIVLLALGLPWLLRSAARPTLLLGVWILAYAAFYSAYVCTHETWWYLRFLLPAAPALVVAGLLVARAALAGPGRRLGRRASAAVCIAVAACILANAAYWSRDLRALSIGRGERKYGEVADWLKARLPGNSVLLVMQASGALFYYTHFPLVRYDWLGDIGETGAKVAKAARRAGQPVYAVLWPFETDEALHRRMPGNWTQVGAVSDVTVWRLDPDAAHLRVALPSR